MKLGIALLLSLCMICGCNGDTVRQERIRYDRAIKTIQDSRSALPGATTMQALDFVVATLSREGYEVKEEGWTCTSSGGKFYIWYNLKINDDPVKFHWIIAAESKTISPGNEITRTIFKTD